MLNLRKSPESMNEISAASIYFVDINNLIMKKNILIFGSIAGLIVSAVMATTAITCYESKAFEGNMVMGFASMFIAFSFIFVAIKNYRDRTNHGAISFGKALQIGLWISLVGSTMYVVCWLIIFYNFYPDYMDKFVSHSIAGIKADKALSAAEMKEQIDGVNQYKVWYRSPVMVILLTYMEILPVGIIVAFLSALFLRKKKEFPAAGLDFK